MCLIRFLEWFLSQDCLDMCLIRFLEWFLSQDCLDMCLIRFLESFLSQDCLDRVWGKLPDVEQIKYKRRESEARTVRNSRSFVLYLYLF